MVQASRVGNFRQTLAKSGIAKSEVDAAACAIVAQWNLEPPRDADAVVVLAHESEPFAPLDLPSVILSQMEEIEPRACEGAMVYIPELRRAVEFLHKDKSEFDKALWSLVEAGRLAVHRYDHAGMLGESERAELLQDESGHYYNGLSLRISP